MTKEVDVEGLVGGLFQGGQLRLQIAGAEHGGGQGAQASSVAHSGRQAVVLYTGHGGLDDGGVQSQSFKTSRHGQTVIAPASRSLVVRDPPPNAVQCLLVLASGLSRGGNFRK